MKATEAQMHLLALNNIEQLTIRLLAQGYLKLLAKAYMNEIHKGKEVESVWRQFLGSFQKIDDLTGGMCTTQQFENTPIKLFNFNDTGMQYLLKVIRSYSSAFVDCLEQDELGIVEEGYENLVKKVETSSQFTYSQEEIQAELKKP